MLATLVLLVASRLNGRMCAVLLLCGRVATVCKRHSCASDGDIPYEGYVPMYADVDVLRRGSF